MALTWLQEPEEAKGQDVDGVPSLVTAQGRSTGLGCTRDPLIKAAAKAGARRVSAAGACWCTPWRAMAIALAASLLLAASAGADTKILGSVNLPAGGATSICGGSGPRCTVVQQQVASASSGSYVLRAPADGTIVSWSYRSANAATGNQYSLRVLRPTNATETSFTAIATSTAPPLPDGNDLVRGPFGVKIPVKAGDRIGLESQGPSDFGVPVFHTAQHDPSLGDGVVFFSPDIGDGSTATPTTTGGNDGSQVLVQATIETASPPPPPVGCPPSCPPSLGPALNGRIAFASEQTGHREIYTMYPDGSNETRLTYDNAHDDSPSYSPDGSKIVFYSENPPHTGVYIMNADGSSRRLVVATPGNVDHPAFSPDGSKIIYETGAHIYLINVDGTGQRLLGVGWDPALSPDGSTIAFVTVAPGDTLGIAVMNADGSNPRLLFDNHFRAADLPSFSPDGSKIAFQMDSPTSDDQIWTINSDGTGMRQLTAGSGAGDHAPVFSPDGTKIAFYSYRAQPVEIYVMNVDGTNQQPITNDPGYHDFPNWQALRATPRLISYRLSRLVFMAARRGPSVILNGRASDAGDITTAGLKTGTTVSFSLNENATLSFVVQVPLAGRRGRGGRCERPTRKNHAHPSCTRYRNLKGGFKINGHIGNNSFLFTGRLNGRELRPGRYALTATARALHKTGQIRRVRFRIVAALPARP